MLSPEIIETLEKAEEQLKTAMGLTFASITIKDRDLLCSAFRSVQSALKSLRKLKEV